MISRLSNGWNPRWLATLTLLFIIGTQLGRAEQTAVAPQPLSPVATSIQSLIHEGLHPKLRWGQFPDLQPQLDRLYSATGYLPVWTQDGKPIPQARETIDSMAKADARGLNAADYDVELLKSWLIALNTPQDAASFDVALTVSAMRYASNLYVGRVNPRHVNFGLDIEPKKLDLSAVVRKLTHSNQPDDDFADLEPKLRLYENLKAALSRYGALKGENQPPLLELPPKFKAGDRHPQVPALRHLLSRLGDLPGNGANGSDVYDKDLVIAVKGFQGRHGLATDGVIGKTTLAQLNFPISERFRQIQLGLERLRWLPEHFDGKYIIVNIPSFQLFGFNDGAHKPDLVMNVIVGEAINERNTPVFHAEMTYVNFRPYWNVPYKITAKEFLPQLLRNPGYLSRNNLEIVSNFSPNAPTYEASLGNIQMLSTGALKLRQRPGPKNALGLIKFAFPNNNNVYLHSTPSQGLFKRARRDFSHGCIRVEYPVELAEFVLANQGDWPKEKIEETMKGDKTRTVTLKTGIPVYIFYSTVLADENGKVMFFDDIYGHDHLLIDLLAKGFPYPP